MTKIIDFTNLEDEFVFHFGGEFRRIKAETFANSLLEFSSALREINRVVNPEFEIEIFIDAIEGGSFKVGIKTLFKKLTPLFGELQKALIVALFANFIYEKIFPDNNDIEIIDNDDSYIFEIDDKKVVFPKEVEFECRKIRENPEVNKCFSKAFKILDSDSEISDFGISRNLEDIEPLVEIPRKEFTRLSEFSEIDVPEDHNRQIEEETDLIIIRAIFKSGPWKWQFVWRDGIVISAPISDTSFFDKLISHEYAIGTGDSLQVKLRIFQFKDEISGVWYNKGYEVFEVKNLTSGPQQQTMFGNE